MSRRMATATTQALRRKAQQSKDAAVGMLAEGRVLRVSSRTDVEQGTIHSGQARYLVRMREAEYLPDPDRDGWKDMTRVRARGRT